MKDREILAIAFACFRFLDAHNFLSPSGRLEVRHRILEYQKKRNIEIIERQIESVEFSYGD